MENSKFEVDKTYILSGGAGLSGGIKHYLVLKDGIIMVNSDHLLITKLERDTMDRLKAQGDTFIEVDNNLFKKSLSNVLNEMDILKLLK